MATIKFERIERDCDYNKRLREEGTRGLIYDFRAVIDGEFRALLKRRITGRGYDVLDAQGRGIERGGMYAPPVGAKADFEAKIVELLAGGRIPTLAQMETMRAREAAIAAQVKADKIERRKLHRTQDAAPDLYEALKLARAALNYPAGVSVRERALEAAEAAIAKAEIWTEDDDAIVAA